MHSAWRSSATLHDFITPGSGLFGNERNNQHQNVPHPAIDEQNWDPDQVIEVASEGFVLWTNDIVGEVVCRESLEPGTVYQCRFYFDLETTLNGVKLGEWNKMLNELLLPGQVVIVHTDYERRIPYCASPNYDTVRLVHVEHMVVEIFPLIDSGPRCIVSCLGAVHGGRHASIKYFLASNDQDFNCIVFSFGIFNEQMMDAIDEGLSHYQRLNETFFNDCMTACNIIGVPMRTPLWLKDIEKFGRAPSLILVGGRVHGDSQKSRKCVALSEFYFNWSNPDVSVDEMMSRLRASTVFTDEPDENMCLPEVTETEETPTFNSPSLASHPPLEKAVGKAFEIINFFVPVDRKKIELTMPREKWYHMGKEVSESFKRAVDCVMSAQNTKIQLIREAPVDQAGWWFKRGDFSGMITENASVASSNSQLIPVAVVERAKIVEIRQSAPNSDGWWFRSQMNAQNVAEREMPDVQLDL